MSIKSEENSVPDSIFSKQVRELLNHYGPIADQSPNQQTSSACFYSVVRDLRELELKFYGDALTAAMPLEKCEKLLEAFKQTFEDDNLEFSVQNVGDGQGRIVAKGDGLQDQPLLEKVWLVAKALGSI